MQQKFFNRTLDIKKSMQQNTREEYDKEFRRSEYYEKRYSKLLKKAMIIEEYLTPELIEIRSKIIKEQLKGNKVAIVCLTGDLGHPGHIMYIKTAREKIKKKFGLSDDNLKIFVGLETSERTKQRKGKEPILNDEERKYQWQHIKGVDEAFVRNVDLKHYPSDLMLYLQPDFWVSHEEYFNKFGKYLRVSRKLKFGTNGKTKAIIVGYEDPDKLLPEGNVRNKWRLSTSEIVRRVLEKQKDFIAKNYVDEVIGILMKIQFGFNGTKK